MKKLYRKFIKDQFGTGSHVLFPIIIVALITLVGVRIAFYSNAAAPTKIACTNTLSGSKTISLQGGAYHLQSNEFDSKAAFTVCNNNALAFSVNTSSINNPGGSPGAYPSLYKGCHWGNCTTNSKLPVTVASLIKTPTLVTSSYNTTVVTGRWDDSYDIWYNPAKTTKNNQSGLELMIWLNHQGGVNPIGKAVTTATIDGIKWTVWHGVNGTTAGTVSYVAVTPRTSVTNLALGGFTADAVNRGYMKSTGFLIDVEAGFEVWIGSAGLTANSFSVTVQ